MSGKNWGFLAASHDTGMRVSGEPCGPPASSSTAPMVKTISAATSTPATVTRSSAATETQLDFLGRYDPPLGIVGDAMDALVGRRIAEASVHRFIGDVARYLREEIARR